MSSILDALKKSERQRGLGRDLIFRNSAPDEKPRLTWFARVVLLALAVLAVAIGVLLFSLRQSETPTTFNTSDSTTPETSTSAINAISATVPVATLRVETAQELKDQARMERHPVVTAKPERVEELMEVSSHHGEAPWLSSLPESFRSSLPPLDVNIHVYSPEQSQRILYINNRQARQGERIQAGVMVEEIVQDGVVLRFRGQRFKLPRPS